MARIYLCHSSGLFWFFSLHSSSYSSFHFHSNTFLMRIWYFSVHWFDDRAATARQYCQHHIYLHWTSAHFSLHNHGPRFFGSVRFVPLALPLHSWLAARAQPIQHFQLNIHLGHSLLNELFIYKSLVRVEWHLILKYLTELKMAFWDFKCHSYVSLAVAV